MLGTVLSSAVTTVKVTDKSHPLGGYFERGSQIVNRNTHTVSMGEKQSKGLGVMGDC